MAKKRTDLELRYLSLIKTMRRRIPQILEREQVTQWGSLRNRYGNRGDPYDREGSGWNLVQPTMRVIFAAIESRAFAGDNVDDYFNILDEYIQLRKHVIVMKLIRSLEMTDTR